MQQRKQQCTPFSKRLSGGLPQDFGTQYQLLQRFSIEARKSCVRFVDQPCEIRFELVRRVVLYFSRLSTIFPATALAGTL